MQPFYRLHLNHGYFVLAAWKLATKEKKASNIAVILESKQKEITSSNINLCFYQKRLAVRGLRLFRELKVGGDVDIL